MVEGQKVEKRIYWIQDQIDPSPNKLKIEKQLIEEKKDCKSTGRKTKGRIDENW